MYMRNIPFKTCHPGTLNNQLLKRCFCETPIFHVTIWSHPTETTIKKWFSFQDSIQGLDDIIKDMTYKTMTKIWAKVSALIFGHPSSWPTHPYGSTFTFLAPSARLRCVLPHRYVVPRAQRQHRPQRYNDLGTPFDTETTCSLPSTSWVYQKRVRSKKSTKSNM